jgi:hypothetical protein
MMKNMEKEIPQIEKELKLAEANAVNIENTKSKMIHHKISDAIDGFISGWNR